MPDAPDVRGLGERLPVDQDPETSESGLKSGRKTTRSSNRTFFFLASPTSNAAYPPFRVIRYNSRKTRPISLDQASIVRTTIIERATVL